MTEGDNQPFECGACLGSEPTTPVTITNAPGRDALVYRVGTHGEFKETMLVALGRQPALARLTARTDDDPAIALIDAWAAALDVLSFYQERIANEDYLRTATQRRSILELARAIGYELRPGVAASTVLAYTLDTTPGSPAVVKIAAGAQAMTTPGPNEQPQTFETSDQLEAHGAWNALTPRRWLTKVPKSGDPSVRLDGIGLNLRQGDPLLIVGDERINDPGSPIAALRRVAGLAATPAKDGNPAYTDVLLDAPLDAATPNQKPRLFVLHQRASLFGAAAPDWRTLPLSARNDYLHKSEGDPGAVTSPPDWPDFSICGISEIGSPTATSGPGLYAEYQIGLRSLRRVDVPPATGSFKLPARRKFSVTWTGRLTVPKEASYKFTVSASGPVRLWIDDNELTLDTVAAAAAAEVRSTSIDLRKDRKYAFVLKFSNAFPAPFLQLEWSYVVPTAGAVVATAVENIPGSQFEPDDHGTNSSRPGLSGCGGRPMGRAVQPPHHAPLPGDGRGR